MITNKQYKEDMTKLLDIIYRIGAWGNYGNWQRVNHELVIPFQSQLDAIPDEESVIQPLTPKREPFEILDVDNSYQAPIVTIGSDPNDRIAKYLSPRELEAFEREMEEDDNFTTPVISHPADPDKDEYMEDSNLHSKDDTDYD